MKERTASMPDEGVVVTYNGDGMHLTLTLGGQPELVDVPLSQAEALLVGLVRVIHGYGDE